MASNDSTARPKNELKAMVNVAQGPLARCLRLTGVGVKVRLGCPVGMMTTRLGCPPPETVTLKLQVERLPAASTAAQVTVVTPSGKAEPDGGAQVTVTPGWLSLTVG